MISARSARHSPARSSGRAALGPGLALEAGLARPAPDGEAPPDGAALGDVVQDAIVRAAIPTAMRVAVTEWGRGRAGMPRYYGSVVIRARRSGGAGAGRPI